MARKTKQGGSWVNPLFAPKPPPPADPLDDPSVVAWEDGRIWQRDASGGWTIRSGPTPQPAATTAQDSEFEALIRWTPVVAKFLAVVFIVLGFLSLVSMVSGHELGCRSVNGSVTCFAILPHR